MIAGFAGAVGWVLLFKAQFYDLYEMIPGFALGFAATIGVSLVAERGWSSSGDTQNRWKELAVGDLDLEKLDRGCFDQDPLKTLRRARLLVIRRVMVQEYLAHRCPSSAKGADRMHGPRSLVSSGTEARISPPMLPPVGLR